MPWRYSPLPGGSLPLDLLLYQEPVNLLREL